MPKAKPERDKALVARYEELKKEGKDVDAITEILVNEYGIVKYSVQAILRTHNIHLREEKKKETAKADGDILKLKADGYSAKEIAEQLDMEIHAVYKAIYRQQEATSSKEGSGTQSKPVKNYRAKRQVEDVVFTKRDWILREMRKNEDFFKNLQNQLLQKGLEGNWKYTLTFARELIAVGQLEKAEELLALVKRGDNIPHYIQESCQRLQSEIDKARRPKGFYGVEI